MSQDIYYWDHDSDDREREPIDFESRLNPAQYEAVTTTEGPILVVAGAGSGKTRTLVHKVAYLVEKGLTPESILLLTFTRKASGEMLRRAAELVGDRCARVSGGTFHSLAHELLRQWAGRIGYPNNFGIMDRGDMEEILGQLRKSNHLGTKNKRFPRRSTLATIISKAANKSKDVKPLMVEEYVHLLEFADDVDLLAREYGTFKQENALLDFDDLLVQLNLLLGGDEEAREAIAGKYKYIMVDEYQDTNLVQSQIIYHLARGHNNVMVVGDDAQSIYSFRGATFRNIMDFPQRFKGTKIVRLEENYRSRQPILDLTNNIISKAAEKYEKKLFTRRGEGPKPRLITTSTQEDQSLFVCQKIKAKLDEGIDLSQMAVLFRAARHSFHLELELARYNIDFVKYGGRRFLDSAHVKDLLSVLRCVANPSDGISLTRTLLLLEGIGPKGASQIIEWIGGKRENLINLDKYPAKGKIKKSLEGLITLFKDLGPKGTPMQLRINECWEFYEPLMEAKFDDFPSRIRDIEEFLTLSKGYTSLTRFLADMSLEPPNVSGTETGSGKLILSTVHSAKGLEWKVVFVIAATDGRFPPIYALDNPEALDEERRLMYVAATRAEDELYLLCPLESDFKGGGPALRPQPSMFLRDVPKKMLTYGDREDREPEPPALPSAPKRERPYRSSPDRKPTLSIPAELGELGPGKRVTHPVFGLGRVIRMLPGRKIRVDFDHFGAKTLHMDYAGLKILE